jgi:hypothetical protein
MKSIGSRPGGAVYTLIAAGLAALSIIAPANAGGITSPAGLTDTIETSL